MEKFIGQLDSAIETSSKDVLPEEMTTAEGTEIDIIPGFPEKVEGEILFLDADNISTDGIYPGILILDYSFCFKSEKLRFADKLNRRQVYIPR
jgi:hypothetical protein